MPLSSATGRQLAHSRSIECQGFYRDDGMWDIEGQIRDRKSYHLQTAEGHDLPPGSPLHDMWLRLTIDDGMVIQAVEATTDASPYQICPLVVPHFQRLKGLSIEKGFNKNVAALLGNTEGCTHLIELVGRLAIVAFQTIRTGNFPGKSAATSSPWSETREKLINSCYALSSEREAERHAAGTAG